MSSATSATPSRIGRRRAAIKALACPMPPAAVRQPAKAWRAVLGDVVRRLGERRLRRASRGRDRGVDRALGRVAAAIASAGERAQRRARARLDQEFRPVDRAQRRRRGKLRRAAIRLLSMRGAGADSGRRKNGRAADRRIHRIERRRGGRGIPRRIIGGGSRLWRGGRARDLRDFLFDQADAIDQRLQHVVDAPERGLDAPVGIALLGAQIRDAAHEGFIVARRGERRCRRQRRATNGGSHRADGAARRPCASSAAASDSDARLGGDLAPTSASTA